MVKRNLYTHRINLQKLTIANKPRAEFRELLEQVNYLGYEVENIHDGRRIVITKPGSKFVYGNIKKEDFMVWVYNPNDSSLWLISHKNIYKDLLLKAETNPQGTVKIIDALERVFNGEEPDLVLDNMTLSNPAGELPEVLLKAYKWIWGQEDSNYPTGEGREMSMKAIRKLRDSLKDM